MRETQHVALARVGMYGREHVVIVRPGEHGILAHTMFYCDEIRFENEFRGNAEAIGTSGDEREKAVRSWGPFERAGPAPVVDIFEALKKSTAIARKPPAPETQPARQKPGRVTEIKNKRQGR